MSVYKELNDAIAGLSRSVSNFPIGAISLNDFKPIEEKILTTRESLKRLNARLLILKTQYGYKRSGKESDDDVRRTIWNLQEATANSLINNTTISRCLHSYTIDAILTGKEGDKEMQTKIYEYMHKLFSINDNILSLQEHLESLVQKQLTLKNECQIAIFDYNNFLKEQDDIRKKKLENTNPALAQNKGRIHSTIYNINLMKKLIVSFIATSHHKIYKKPFLVEMLARHKKMISIETILRMSQTNTEKEHNESSTSA